MLERFYLKEHLSFREVSLEFDKNFIVFTGPSGAGKSILMEALLSLFGLKECDAGIVEAAVSQQLDLERFGIEEDTPNIFRLTRTKSARYFINNQQVSRKNIRIISKSFINYLTLREFTEFENDKMLALLDAIAVQQNPGYADTLEAFRQAYARYSEIAKKLTALREEEQRIEELREFARFEIDKIEKIAPDVDEYEKLMEQKKALSRREKLQEAIGEASQIFALRGKVSAALSLIDADATFFEDAMTQLELLFEETDARLEELEDLDIESLLTRIEQLSDLKRKYGSIEEALAYLQKKRDELEHYENLGFEKASLEQEEATLREEVTQRSAQMHAARAHAMEILQGRIEHYLNMLYLRHVRLTLEPAPLGALGADLVTVGLAHADLKKLSSGELNRLRLAFLAASGEFIQSGGGVLILDEIDANVSGKESTSIAAVLQKLSESYQIFAISHQPQLSSRADMHYLVEKTDGESRVTLLDQEGRIRELSRMISAEEITDEARNFAKTLLAQK